MKHQSWWTLFQSSDSLFFFTHLFMLQPQYFSPESSWRHLLSKQTVICNSVCVPQCQECAHCAFIQQPQHSMNRSVNRSALHSWRRCDFSVKPGLRDAICVKEYQFKPLTEQLPLCWSGWPPPDKSQYLLKPVSGQFPLAGSDVF